MKTMIVVSVDDKYLRRRGFSYAEFLDRVIRAVADECKRNGLDRFDIGYNPTEVTNGIVN